MSLKGKIKTVFRLLEWIESSTVILSVLFFFLYAVDLFYLQNMSLPVIIFFIISIVLNLALDRMNWVMDRKIEVLGIGKVNLKKSPALFLLKIIDLLPKKQRQSLIQEISDMRLEYYEALSEKKIWRARFIVAAYYIGLCWSVIMWISDKVKEVVGIIPKKN